MDDLEGLDPSLFRVWSTQPLYGEAAASEDAALAEEARSVLLETKSAEGTMEPAEELRRLLNEMTVEMRDQFATFRRMRTAADQVLEDGDEAAQKLARADVKAATDAMSLIVRTLEKVDSLQRQLARDRALEAERAADQGGYQEAKQRFIKMIEDRANETAWGLYEAWKRDGPPDWASRRLANQGTEPANEEAGPGMYRRQGTDRNQDAQPADEAHCGTA
jgi:hypothetical protein